MGRALEPVNFGGHDEVVLGEASCGVRPQGNLDPTPTEPDIRMVTLGVGDLSDAVHEHQGAVEIWELENPCEMVI